MSKLNKVILSAACVALGISYVSYYAYNNYFSKEKPKQIDIELTKKMLQQIKHQMLITCINFTNQMQKRAGQVNLQDANTSEFLKTEMGKIYQQKENLVLAKYNFDSASYADALKKYGNQQFIKNAQKQIIDMMERSVAGRLPDLTVNRNVKSKFTKDQVGEIYFDLCQKIVLLVLNRLREQKRNDPYFDSRDDESFRRAIRSLSIYDYKVEYLSTKGFDKAWGCPNQNFFKLIEGWKAEDAEYKKKIMKIQKSYEKAIQQISADPQRVDQRKIKQYFTDSNPSIKQDVVIAPLKQPQQSIEQQFSSQNISNPVTPEKLVDEHELKRTDSAQYINKPENQQNQREQQVLKKPDQAQIVSKPENQQNQQVAEVNEQKSEHLNKVEVSGQDSELLNNAQVSGQNSEISKSAEENGSSNKKSEQQPQQQEDKDEIKQQV